MNIEFILSKVKSYLKNNNQLLEEDFNNIFKGLEIYECEIVKNILKEAGIVVVSSQNISYENHTKIFKLDENKILEMVKPFVNSYKEILEKDFNSLFNHLSHKQCYAISDFLFSQGISIVYNDDDDNDESKLVTSINLNDEYILKIITPYLKGCYIQEKHFNELFGQFGINYRYKISDILLKHNIYIDYEDEDLDDISNQKEKIRSSFNYVPLIEFGHPIEITSGDISVLKGLNNEQLCLMYQRGSELALHLLICNNQKMVYKRAVKYGKIYNHKLDLEDLISLGNEGLIEAAKRFDQSIGAKFSTYTIWWIDNKVRGGIMDTGFSIRIPANRFTEINKILRIQREYKIENEDELIQYAIMLTGFSKDKVKELLRLKGYCYSLISLNIQVCEENNSELVEFIEDRTIPSIEDQIFTPILRKELEGLITKLTQREREVIYLRFGLDDGQVRTYEDIAKEFGVTGTRIRLVESKALRKLSRYSKQLIDFL